MKYRIGLATTIAALILSLAPASAQVVLVEQTGHVLTKIVDSAAPLDLSQLLLEDPSPEADIESIGIDPATGDLFVQLQDPPGSFESLTTHIFRISPAGVVLQLSDPVDGTGFSINSRGTDLHFDPSTGFLVTQDQDSPNLTNSGIVTHSTVAPLMANPIPFVPFLFFGGTFGMDFSAGEGSSDVPAGEVLFTTDVTFSGIYSTPLLMGGGAVTATHVIPPTAGDDIVIQLDGDWVHVPDFDGVITAYLPAAPHTPFPSTGGLDSGLELNIEDMFDDAGLPFIFGSRATVCDTTGDLYISYSGGTGGTGIFRVDEDLNADTLVLTIGIQQDGSLGSGGLHDLTLGPSTVNPGSSNSVYFTVHNTDTFGEEVWEVTVPECVGGEEPAIALIIDEDTIGNGISTIEEISFNSPNCGDGEPSVCVNDDIADLGVRDILFTLPNDVTSEVTGLVLPTGEFEDEGLFKFTKDNPQKSKDNDDAKTFTVQEFIFAAGAAAKEDNLDKIEGVLPLTQEDIYALEGHVVCAVVYDSDVSTDVKDNYGSLKGSTLGLTAFEVTAVGPDPDGPGGSVLPLITVDLKPSAEVVSICEGALPDIPDSGGPGTE